MDKFEPLEQVSMAELMKDVAPSLEEQYANAGYIYNAEKNVWEAKPRQRRITEKPERPSVGDIWTDPTSNSMYVYYEDHEDHQWIQVGGSTSGA